MLDLRNQEVTLNRMCLRGIMVAMIKFVKARWSRLPLREFSRRRRRLARSKSYFTQNQTLARAWSKKHTEFSNFYYDLTPKNRMELASLIAAFFDTNIHDVLEYFKEVDSDPVLNTKLEDFKSNSPQLKDSSMLIGRRLGWYAIARIIKPAVVVETGVHHGVGALVLSRALQLNRSEGFKGAYFGTDIDLNAGFLIKDFLSENCSVLYGDSIESLRTFGDQTIDLFINDSDHSVIYEYQEFLEVESKLSKRGIILGDNSHISDSLMRFSMEKNRRFVFFAEKPLNHWYPGAGIGISLP